MDKIEMPVCIQSYRMAIKKATQYRAAFFKKSVINNYSFTIFILALDSP